jgi:hypothetical protein
MARSTVDTGRGKNRPGLSFPARRCREAAFIRQHFKAGIKNTMLYFIVNNRIRKHYDNNPDVVNELKDKGIDATLVNYEK